MVVVALRYPPEDLHGELAARPENLRVLRRLVRDWADGAGLSADITTDLQLAISEAAENAIEHAYTDQADPTLWYHISYTADQSLQVEITDHGRWRVPPEDSGHRGRGLSVIRDVTEQFHLDATPTGTQIRFTLPATPKT